MGALKEKFYRFMVGRYGIDYLNKALMYIAMGSLILSFFGIKMFYWIALILLIVSYMRMFSKNIAARRQENIWFYNKMSKIRKLFTYEKTKFKQRKIYHIFKCPTCKQKIRVPKGRGKIEIRCSKCGTCFIKKS